MSEKNLSKEKNESTKSLDKKSNDEGEEPVVEPGMSCKERFVSYVKSHLFLQIVFVVYSASGAAIFNAIEGPNEMDAIQEVAVIRNRTLDRIWNISHREDITEEQWRAEAFREILDLQSVTGDLLQPAMNLATNEPIWNFWSSLLFCGTVTTTIGYGFIAPKTTAGRAVCIVYALLGIPLCLMVLTHIGQYMTLAIKKIYYHLFLLARFTRIGECCHLWKKTIKRAVRNKMIKHKAKPGDTSTPNTPASATAMSDKPPLAALPTDEEATISELDRTASEDTVYEEEDFEPSPLFSIMFVVLYALFGAFMYRRWEKWDYFESVYFIVVSLTTIGFGDINPKHPKFFIAASIYLLIGLALVSMLINTLVIFVKKSYKKAKEVTLELGQKAKDQLDDIINDSDDEDQDDFVRSKLKQYIVNPRLSLQSDRRRDSNPGANQGPAGSMPSPPGLPLPAPGVTLQSEGRSSTKASVHA